MKKQILVGSDFSGVGAFNQALIRLGIEFKELFACDMDKFARETFIHNYGQPEYYPTNVYEREIPKQSLDIYMTSPPCQAFSLAGKRLGKNDKRGILFFNSHEFIKVNKPRFFIFENVKGLLSDDNGKTFTEWINYLGGKSINGLPIIFPHEESVPYHIYYKVLNAKNYNVPQNRERIFIIGIRDDQDNNFRFPIEQHLTKKLKDVLENKVDKKYILNKKTLNQVLKKEGKYTGINDDPTRTLTTRYLAPNGTFLKVNSGTIKGYEIATENDSINFSFPTSKTKRGRVGKQVAQTLDTTCQQAVLVGDYRTDEGFRWRKDGNSPAIMAMMRDTWKDNFTGQNPPIIKKDYKIRRLTPRECFRLMDFPDSFTWPVSDSQAYKQAGNSIVVNVLYKILKNLNL